MTVRRPSLDEAMLAIRRFPVDPEPDGELAEALQLTAEVHTASQANADRAGRYGRCVGCGQWWPCPSFQSAEEAARGWVWEAAQQVMARYRWPVREKVAA